MKVSDVKWNSFPEYKPEKELRDDIALSYYLCKFETSLGFDFEVCKYDFEEQEFVFDYAYCGGYTCKKELVAWVQFNGENI